MEELLNQLQKTKDGKKKAIHLLFDEIKTEIPQLEKFIKEETSKSAEGKKVINNLRMAMQVFKAA